MKKLLIIVLTGSVLANLWLIARSRAKATVESERAVGTASVPASTKPENVAAIAREVARVLASGDVTALRAELIAAGVDGATLRALVEGALRRRYESQLSEWRIDRFRNAWWRGGTWGVNGPPAPSARAWVRDPLQAALGRDPLDLAAAELRYEFLSPEKKRLLALIDLDYAEMRAGASAGNPLGGFTKAEVDQRELLLREKKKDTLAALNAEERAEYELRFGSAATSNALRFAAMEASEPEFRAIVPVMNAFEEQVKTLRSGQPDYLVIRGEMEQNAMDRLVGILGYERSVDFCWAVGSGPYLPTVRLMQEANLPASHAAQLLQLAAETGRQGAAIHRDPTLTSEQKESALAGLQSTVRPQFDALVPTAVQPKLNTQVLDWFTALGEGCYVVFRPWMSGNAWIAPATFSISAPLRSPQPPVSLPRRIGK